MLRLLLLLRVELIRDVLHTGTEHSLLLLQLPGATMGQVRGGDSEEGGRGGRRENEGGRRENEGGRI